MLVISALVELLIMTNYQFILLHGYTQLHGITSRNFVLKKSIKQQLNTGIEIADIMIIEKVIRD